MNTSLREARERAGLTKTALAQRAGITDRWMRCIEAGHRPSFKTAEALSKALRVSIDELFTDQVDS